MACSVFLRGAHGDAARAEVEPPGVFLDASAVLERQLTACCLDRWVETGLPISAIPPKIGTVLNQLEACRPDKFPGNSLDFLKSRQTALCDSFFARFGADLTSESVDHSCTFAVGDRAMD